MGLAFLTKDHPKKVHLRIQWYVFIDHLLMHKGEYIKVNGDTRRYGMAWVCSRMDGGFIHRFLKSRIRSPPLSRVFNPSVLLYLVSSFPVHAPWNHIHWTYTQIEDLFIWPCFAELPMLLNCDSVLLPRISHCRTPLLTHRSFSTLSMPFLLSTAPFTTSKTTNSRAIISIPKS